MRADVDPSQITHNAARARIVELRTELARHNELYFKKSAPEISDAEYDQLKRELLELEQAHPEVARDSSRLVPVLGDDRSGLFPTYRHRQRMLSLNKCYTESELRAFDARLRRLLGRSNLEYMVEPKFDGLAVSVTYERGRLVRAVTRGDGVEGDDVTANILTIRSLPRELASSASAAENRTMPERIELRGEVYFTLAEFARINQEREDVGEQPYAHPRNLAAGTLKLLDPQEVAQRKLSIVFYGWGACEPTEAAPESQQALLTQLKTWGVPTITVPRCVQGVDALWEAVQLIGRERQSLPIPIDGAVVKLDAVIDRMRLGETEQAPNWAIAYKFQPEQTVTQVRDITIQIGRTGLLTPVAELVPVSLGGSTITRATLHNREEIFRRDIRVGDFVQLEKAGEIIPMITAVIFERRSVRATRYLFPEKCPVCQTPVLNNEGETAVRCPNNNCPAQVRRRLEYFASKSGVDISGLGPEIIDALVRQGRVESVADLYRLQRADLLLVSGVGEKKADRLLSEIERSRSADLWRFINGLGIPLVGASTAKVLAARFGSLSALARCTRQELQANSARGDFGLGSSREASVLGFFSRTQNQLLIAGLLDHGVRPINRK